MAIKIETNMPQIASDHQSGKLQLDHPVFRGLRIIGVDCEELARISRQPPELVAAWIAGKAPVPDAWAILYTRLLAAMILSHDPQIAAVAAKAGEELAERLERAENWLALAQEAIKDLPPNAHHDAEKLASNRAA